MPTKYVLQGCDAERKGYACEFTNPMNTQSSSIWHALLYALVFGFLICTATPVPGSDSLNEVKPGLSNSKAINYWVTTIPVPHNTEQFTIALSNLNGPLMPGYQYFELIWTNADETTGTYTGSIFSAGVEILTSDELGIDTTMCTGLRLNAENKLNVALFCSDGTSGNRAYGINLDTMTETSTLKLIHSAEQNWNTCAYVSAGTRYSSYPITIRFFPKPGLNLSPDEQSLFDTVFEAELQRKQTIHLDLENFIPRSLFNKVGYWLVQAGTIVYHTPFGNRYETPDDLMGFQTYEKIGYDQMSGLRMFAEGDTSRHLFAAHVTDIPEESGGDWWTGIGLFNGSDADATVTALSYDEQGNLIDESQIVVAPDSKHVGLARSYTMLPYEDLDQLSHMEFVSDTPICGFEVFGHYDIDEKEQVGLSLQTEIDMGFLLDGAYVIADDEMWTGLTVINTTDSPVDASIYVLDQQGTIIGKSSITLPPKGKQVGLIQNMIEMVDGFNEQDIAKLRITDDRNQVVRLSNPGLIAFTITGDQNHRMGAGFEVSPIDLLVTEAATDRAVYSYGETGQVNFRFKMQELTAYSYVSRVRLLPAGDGSTEEVQEYVSEEVHSGTLSFDVSPDIFPSPGMYQAEVYYDLYKSGTSEYYTFVRKTQPFEVKNVD